MRIGIDISPIQYAGTGVARYTEALIEHLLLQKGIHEYTLFYSSFGNVSAMERFTQHTGVQSHVQLKSFPIPEFMLHFLWNDHHMFPIELLIGKQDVFFYSDWLMPPFSRKKVTTVHDLAFMKYPETVHPYILKTQQKRFERLIKEDFAIICDSYATQKDLLDLYPIYKDKTTVIYPGVSTIPQTAKIRSGVLKELGLGKSFILTVGKKEPRKNMSRLVDAFKKLKTKDIELVIVGPAGWEAVTVSDGVRVIPFIADKYLFALYQEALFFVMPSLYEGFGFPLVEAMSLGCPTACSETSSLAEIGAGASYFFDPQKTDSIYHALQTMSTDTKLRETLAMQGKKKAMGFSWEKTARATISFIEKQ
jgi:glycosyltransferase involved in cell wall biosynthesis